MAAVSDIIEITAGPLSLGLVPGIGGSVSHFRLDGIDLMRPLSAADLAVGNVLGVAMFPMVPYANRIAGNAFSFEWRTYEFAANNPPEKFNVHGTGWHRPWVVDEVGPSEVRLSLEVAGADEPYAYRATQRFVLDVSGLSIEMTLTNLASQTMPFGFGLHPWFIRDPDVTMQFAARQFYLEEPDGVSGNPITVPQELDFAQPRHLPQGWRNNDYGGWGGHAALRFPTRGVALDISAGPVFRHLMVYADPTKPFFCVEPQSNASCAFNRPNGYTDEGEGVIVLAPGASTEGMVRFEAKRI
jgi:aldose 1-epimerase